MTNPIDSDGTCPGCGALDGVQSQPAPPKVEAWTCTACGLHWCTTVVNPHVRAALAVISLLPDPQQRTAALLDVMRAEVTRRSGRDTPRVATASDDGTARVFDVVSGAERARLPHDGPVLAVVFSPDGARVATASNDRTARVSTVDADLLLDAVERRIPRPLTDAEWERYGGRPIAHDPGILRSTVSVDETLLATARHRALLRGQTLGQFVEGSLRRELVATDDTADRP